MTLLGNGMVHNELCGVHIAHYAECQLLMVSAIPGCLGGNCANVEQVVHA